MHHRQTNMYTARKGLAKGVHTHATTHGRVKHAYMLPVGLVLFDELGVRRGVTLVVVVLLPWVPWAVKVCGCTATAARAWCWWHEWMSVAATPAGC